MSKTPAGLLEIAPRPKSFDDGEESIGGGSSVTSVESFETEVWDNETVAAVSRTTHQQMLQRQPILIGCNRDGTINVQLPNGNIIVAEASAFPSFGAKLALQQTTNGAYHVLVSQQPSQNQKKETATKSIKKHPTAQVDKIPREVALANMIPNDASGVFHIFHRRVNMDAFRPSSARGIVSTYALLRAWVQDDPYRYTLPDTIEDPATLHTTPPTKEEPIVYAVSPPHHPIPTDTTLRDMGTTRPTATTTGGSSLLLADMAQRGRKRRKRLQQRLAAKDQRLLQRMEERGFFR